MSQERFKSGGNQEFIHKKAPEGGERMETPEEMEAEKKIKRVFIEIGTGTLPVPSRGPKSREFGEEDIYIGIERSRWNIVRAQRDTRAEKRLGTKKIANAYFVEADAAEALPIRDKVADEVYIGNVIGEEFGIFVFPGILKESHRVLKEDGKLIIVETNTPYKRDKVVQMIEQYGFNVEKIIDTESSDWEEVITAYEGRADPYLQYYPTAYVIFARPGTKPK